MLKSNQTDHHLYNLLIYTKKPSEARRCFPSWDEPDFKATFDIKIIAEKEKTVLSNMVSV